MGSVTRDGLQTADVDAVSFDLFGTLVTVDRPDDPAAAVGDALRERGVPVPADWPRRYRSSEAAASSGEAVSLYDHVAAALEGAVDDSVDRSRVADAVDAAFDRDVDVRPEAPAAVQRVADHVPVGVLSNSAVPGLVERSMRRSALPGDAVDVVLASVDLGVRKPDRRAFEAVATRLGVEPGELTHVGDDPRTDGGVERVGGTFVHVESSLAVALATMEETESAVELEGRR
ncbi:MAG: HAD family hydrolase [Halanaeroarchaeum sp.]